jgi:hypothetical protein
VEGFVNPKSSEHIVGLHDGFLNIPPGENICNLLIVPKNVEGPPIRAKLLGEMVDL